MSFENAVEAGARMETAIMKWQVSNDRMLRRNDFVTRGFAMTMSGKKIVKTASEPQFMDPHPTPGAAKVPELTKGDLIAAKV